MLFFLLPMLLFHSNVCLEALSSFLFQRLAYVVTLLCCDVYVVTLFVAVRMLVTFLHSVCCGVL